MSHDIIRRQSKIRVAIIGAGVSGLLLAYMLRRDDITQSIDVQVFEKEKEFVRSTGCGMTLWPFANDVLDKYGLRDAFERIITRGESEDIALQIRRSSLPPTSASKVMHTASLDSSSGPASYHRAHLLDLLASRLPLSSIHLNTALVSYNCIPGGDSVNLSFSNGASSTCDVLFACDGLYSTVRTLMCKVPSPTSGGLPEAASPKWTGGSMFKAVIPLGRLNALLPGHPSSECMQIYLGRGNAYIQTYPIAFGQSLNFIALFSDPAASSTASYSSSPSAPRLVPRYMREITREGLELRFAGWCSEALQLIRLIPDAAFGPKGVASLWPINSLTPLSSYTAPFSSPRVALIGDAAHASAPHLLLGASSAIDDVLVLSTLFKHRGSRRNIPLVLRVYDELRKSEGRQVMESSAYSGALLERIGNGMLRDDDAKAELDEIWGYLEKAQDDPGMCRVTRMEQLAKRTLEKANVEVASSDTYR